LDFAINPTTQGEQHLIIPLISQSSTCKLPLAEKRWNSGELKPVVPPTWSTNLVLPKGNLATAFHVFELSAR
jgi:hypothetical protein